MARREVSPLPHARVQGRIHRLINSRYPPVGVFDDLTDDPDEKRVALALEQQTNPRLASAALHLPSEEILSGEMASVVMAAFIHTDERGGRFHDNRLGAWYAARDIETAIAETVFHNHRRLAKSEAGFPARVQVREFIGELDAELVDVRRGSGGSNQLYDPDPDQYGKTQSIAADLRWPSDGSRNDGLVYDSVRRKGGENVCLLWPTAVPRPVQGDHYDYAWDRHGAVTVSRLQSP